MASKDTKPLTWSSEGQGSSQHHWALGWIPGVSKAESLCWRLSISSCSWWLRSSLADIWIISTFCLHGHVPLPALLSVFLTRILTIAFLVHPHNSRSFSPHRIMRNTDPHSTIGEDCRLQSGEIQPVYFIIFTKPGISSAGKSRTPLAIATPSLPWGNLSLWHCKAKYTFSSLSCFCQGILSQ